MEGANRIMAIVTTAGDQIGGGAPIFHVKDEMELQQLAFRLEKIMDVMAHDVGNGTIILVTH